MATQASSVNLNGMNLRPAPFVSTSYEYNTSGDYVIGGFLIVNLDGTIVGKDSGDLISQMAAISALQTSSNCVGITIGCQGNADFLNGAGRVRNVSINKGDQPFLLTYTITLALETVDGSPAVEPDEEFLNRHCLSKEDAKFILSYSESLSIEGDGSAISSTDGGFNVSKSYIKGKGSISLTCFGKEICGIPQFNGIDQALLIIEARANALINFTMCIPDHPLSAYSGWSKWLDTKQLEINDSGTITWSFDLYMSNGGGTPFAWVDINTEDKKDHKTQKPKTNRSVSGTIRGLSLATSNFLGHKATANERLANADKALGVVLPQVVSGSWPGESVDLSGQEGNCNNNSNDPCSNNEPETCYQRLSSNISRSVVSGEITFNAEYGDINACKPQGDTNVDVSVEETLPATRYVEFIVPNIQNAIVQYMGDTPHKATVTVKGDLNGCDQTKIQKTIQCVENEFNKAVSKYNGWLVTNNSYTINTYSYSKTRSFVKCG